MPVRPIHQLRDMQQRMLDEYRRQQSSMTGGGAEAGAEAPAGVYRLGRVTQVVSSDPALGPHLLVALQALAGTPPTASDVPVSAQPVYPTPNHDESAYSVDDYVAVWTVDGVEVAARLA